MSNTKPVYVYDLDHEAIEALIWSDNDLLATYVARSSMEQAVRIERSLKEMLGRWVSELEPVLVLRRNPSDWYIEVLGLTEFGDPTCTLGIRP